MNFVKEKWKWKNFTISINDITITFAFYDFNFNTVTYFQNFYDFNLNLCSILYDLNSDLPRYFLRFQYCNLLSILLRFIIQIYLRYFYDFNYIENLPSIPGPIFWEQIFEANQRSFFTKFGTKSAATAFRFRFWHISVQKF